MARRVAPPQAIRPYETNAAYLTDELRKLDLLIQRRVIQLRLQRGAEEGMSAAQGLYISHEAVDGMLHQGGPSDCISPEVTMIDRQIGALQDQIDEQVASSFEHGVFLALPHLAHCFALSSFEVQTVMICLAPELRRKYDKLYAYLQDDITRQQPSIDLVLELLCASESECWDMRAAFSEQAPLLRTGILQKRYDSSNPSGSSGLSQFLRLDARLLHYILGHRDLDARLEGIATLYHPASTMEDTLVDATIKTQLANLSQAYFSKPSSWRHKLILYLYGPYGVGKRDLALGLCVQWRCPLICLDMEQLLARETDVETRLRLFFREGLLHQAALYVDHAEVLLREDGKAKAWAKTLAHVMAEYGWVVFLAGEKPWTLHGVFEQALFRAIELPMPDAPLRQLAWEQALERFSPTVDSTWSRQLGLQFRLTPGQIRDAAARAEQRRVMRGEKEELTLSDLYAACRGQSHHKLGELAIKVEPHYGWEDLVLPVEQRSLLHEIYSQVKHRYQVFGEWGFQRKLAHGRGLSVLFTGPSGTGKTMAAEVMAYELSLDLYKIDLSGVVSKYIGETEKNLEMIFHEAESSNAILFFDEADALFGKRTEVSDAHDRYANIETSYLLQRMELYEGMVILATNLRENMDEAFTRRIRFVVEFPFPSVESRRQIWQAHIPPEAPVSDDLDYDWLAQRLQITGGNIKNIVLNAAFFAAEEGEPIRMAYILRGAKREFEKIGKLWNDQLFVQAQR